MLIGLRVLCVCGTAAGCAGMLLAWSAGNGELARVLRFVASISPLSLAAACGALATWYGRWTLLALAYCGFGDWLLASHGFVPGLFAFLMGHVAFMAASLARGIDTKPLAMSCAALMLPACAVLAWLHGRIPSQHIVPVLAYLAVISAMVAFAVGASWRHKAPVLVLAACTLYVSDLFVARSTFVRGGLINAVLGLPLYYAALVLFALSTLGAASDEIKQAPSSMVESKNRTMP